MDAKFVLNPTFFGLKLFLDAKFSKTQNFFKHQHHFRPNLFFKNNVQSQIFFGSKFFIELFFWPKIYFGQKICWCTIFGPKISSEPYFFFWPNNFFRPIICFGLGDFHWGLGVKPFQAEPCRLKSCFGPKISFDSKLIFSKHYLDQ